MNPSPAAYMWLHQQFSLMSVKFIQKICATDIFFFMVNRGTLNISDCTRTITIVFSLLWNPGPYSYGMCSWISGPLELMVLVNGTQLPRTVASAESVLLFCNCLIFNLNLKTLLSDNNTCFYLWFFPPLLRVMCLSAVQLAIVNFHPGINCLII